MDKKSTRRMVQLALLLAIQILMVTTNLGFIPLPVMHITLMHIPVIIGAITLGPKAGGFLGLVFGVASMIVATQRGTPDAMVFSPYWTKSIWSVVLAVVPRVLFGLITAYLFQLLLKSGRSQRVSAGLAAGVGSLLHTIMVLGGIYVLFKDVYAQHNQMAQSALLAAFGFVVVTNGLVEALVGGAAAAALVTPLGLVMADGERA